MYYPDEWESQRCRCHGDSHALPPCQAVDWACSLLCDDLSPHSQPASHTTHPGHHFPSCKAGLA